MAGRYATLVDDIADADIAVMRIAAPFEPRPGQFESMFHAGSLEYPREVLDRLLGRLRAIPTVVDVHLDRPAVLTELAAAALTVSYGCSDEALLDALFGITPPTGRLPVDLPRSMQAVEQSRTDTPFDTADPLFVHGHGITI